MRRILGAIALAIMMVCLMSVSVLAVPGAINYQGKLTDADAVPLDGTYTMKFYLYDAESDGSILWSEQQDVNVTNGIYNVQLGTGEGDAFSFGLFDNDGLHLEIRIYNPATKTFETLSPRQRLTSVAFAMRAGDADTLNGVRVTELEESGEIDSKMASHVSDSAAHHTKTTSFSELTDTAADDQIPNDITINHASTAGDADTLDGKHSGEFLDTSGNNQTKSGGLNITGNVGIGTTSPEETLHVFGDTLLKGPLTIDTSRTGTMKLDQSQTSKGFTFLLNADWQSFTAGIDGILTSVEVLSNSNWSWGEATLKVYEGEGADGNMLYESRYDIGTAPSDGLISFEIPLESAPEMANGSLYTFQINDTSGLVWLDLESPYPGGRCSSSTDHDLWFRTYVNVDYNLGGAVAVTREGNVGIGTTTPQAKLDVAGQIRAGSVTRNYAYVASYTGHDMYSSNWTQLNGLPECIITTFGRPLKVTMDFSATGIYHGGIRLLMDGNTIFGGDPTYGFDWVLPASNQYIKRNIMRVITGIPAGTHSFIVQVRSQSDGSQFKIYGGSKDQNYGGFHLLIEEL